MWAFNGSYSPPEEVGPPNPFSSKFGPAPLPAIQSHTPQPTDDNQIVPYGRSRSHLSSQITNMQPTGEFSDNRLRALESRLSVAEQSNRALLEEVVRLQGELKQSHRLTEETIQTERQARQQLTDNIRASNDLIGQLGARLKRAEEKVSDERTAVGALVNHTKQVEQAVIGSQQELMAKRDQQISKISELQNELDEANRHREQLERTTTTLIDEVRQMKGRMDAAGVEFNSVLHDIKDKTKRIEDEQRAAINQQRKIHESQSTSGQATSVLRTQLDARLGEVRDVLMDLRNRITTEETERRQMEQTAQIKLNDLQSQIHEQVRKRDETMHALGLAQREREHAADNERLKMQGKIAEIAEEVSRKILSKEIRLREEAQQKFSNIEKYLHAEQAARIAHEQAMREENEKRWAALQKLTEEEVLHVREGQKLDRHKSIGSINKVSEMMQTLEKQQTETKKQLEQVMKAEIKSRQSQDKQIEDKIEDVQEKLGVAISTLQQAIGGINDQVIATTNESQGILKAMIEERSSGSLRGLADLDSRLMALQAKVSNQEEELTAKFTETLAIALDEKDEKITKAAVDAQQEQIDALNDWQDSAEKKLKHIKERMDELGPQIREMNRTNESLQDNMKGLVDTESKDRIRDVQMVRQDLETKYRQLIVEIGNTAKTAKPTAVPDIPVTQKEKLAQGKMGKGGKLDEATKEKIEILDEEFHKLKEQVSKVETSVQTVRVHLARKIEAETRSRREEIHDLQAVFEDLHAKVDPSGAKKQEKNKPKVNESTSSPKKDGRSSAKGKSSAKSSPSKGNAKGTPKKSPKNDEKGDSPKKEDKEDNKKSKNDGKTDKKSPGNSGKSEGQGGSKDDNSGRTGGNKDGGQRSQGGDGR